MPGKGFTVSHAHQVYAILRYSDAKIARKPLPAKDLRSPARLIDTHARVWVGVGGRGAGSGTIAAASRLFHIPPFSFPAPHAPISQLDAAGGTQPVPAPVPTGGA